MNRYVIFAITSIGVPLVVLTYFNLWRQLELRQVRKHYILWPLLSVSLFIAMVVSLGLYVGFSKQLVFDSGTEVSVPLFGVCLFFGIVVGILTAKYLH